MCKATRSEFSLIKLPQDKKGKGIAEEKKQKLEKILMLSAC